MLGWARRAAPRLLAAGLLLLGTAPAAVAQTETEPPPGPRPSDWTSPDAIIDALYEVISVAPGEAVDWEREHALFAPGAREISISTTEDGQIQVRNMSVEGFAEWAGATLAEGFVEREIGRVSESYGNIVQAFSAYEGRRSPEGPVLVRGINSIQLYWDGARWWVASIVWDAETPDNPIPARYLLE